MSDLHAREGSSRDWDQPVVELVEDGRVVGIVYIDQDTLFTDLYPDEDGDAWAFEVGDLQTALDTARAMLLPEGTSLLAADVDSTGTHPIDRIAEEFDVLAIRRGEEDEGFYPLAVAARLVHRADELGVAVVSLEGFRLEGEFMEHTPGLAVDIGEAHAAEAWPTFVAGCNVQAMAVLERWGAERELAVAIELGDEDGDRYVM